MKLPKQKTEDEIKEFEAAKAQARESAEKNRNLLFGSLLIFIFLIFVVLQTTDVDLLVGATIKLPVVDVNIPLTALYFLSAPLTFFVHLNLLRNIEAHAVKLQAWRQQAGKYTPLKAADLFPFIFDFAVVDRESSLAGLTSWFSQLVIYWLGTLTLFLIFWRFTDYQSLWVTVPHVGLLIADLIVLRAIREKILDILSSNEAKKTEESKILSVWKSVKRYLFLFLGGWTCTRNGKGEKLSQTVGFTIVLVSYVQMILFISLTLSSFDLYKWVNLTSNTLAYKRFLFSEPPTIKDFSSLLPILIIDQQENLLTFNESLLRRQHKLSSDPDEKFGQWFMKNGVGIDLRNRNLRYAQLPSADLRRAQLRKTDLFKAGLERAKLRGADLRDAKLQHAKLWKAELQRANLLYAELQHANLFQAQLQDAKFRWAGLQGAYLREANLQGADLWRAELQGADLIAAKLQGADLEEVNLQGADLIAAKLQGADLRQANLQDVDLIAARLQGTSLREARLQGADLRIANLQGADLRNFDFGGVNLNKTMMRDVLTDESLPSGKIDSIDWNDLQRVVDDRILKFSSAGEIKEAYLLSFEMVELSNKAKKGAEKPKSSEELINRGERVAEKLKSNKLIKTLEKTICDMKPETELETETLTDTQKYAVEGIIRNYGPSESDSDRKPTQKMQSVHDHFKALKATLDCKTIKGLMLSDCLSCG